MRLGSKEIQDFGKDAEIDYFFLELFKHRDSIENNELKKRFVKKFTQTNLEGIKYFLSAIDLIELTPKKVKKIEDEFWGSENKHDLLFLKILKKLRKTNEHLIFFKEDLIKFDNQNVILLIDKLPREYTALSRFLVQRNYLVPVKETPFFKIDSKFLKDIFKGGLSLPRLYINDSLSQKKLDEILQKKNEINKKLGLEAEEWTLKYEKNKFKGKVPDFLFDRIESISEESSRAGFDIISLKDEKSLIPDKFIEVKSFGTERRFFWSRNEMRVAREKKNQYFLYLINRKDLGDPSYKPIEIQNPCKKILNGKSLEEEFKFVNKHEGFVVESDSFMFTF